MAAAANIGIDSRFFAVVLVRPAASTRLNRRRIILSGCVLRTRALPNVHALQAAIGERSGHSELYPSDTLNIDHRTYAANGNARRTLPIQMVALDHYFKPGHRVDLIKMDVQGYELHALRGASRVLADNPGIKLLLEFWPYGLKQAGARNWVESIGALKENGKLIEQVSSEGMMGSTRIGK